MSQEGINAWFCELSQKSMAEEVLGPRGNLLLCDSGRGVIDPYHSPLNERLLVNSRGGEAIVFNWVSIDEPTRLPGAVPNPCSSRWSLVNSVGHKTKRHKRERGVVGKRRNWGRGIGEGGW